MIPCTSINIFFDYDFRMPVSEQIRRTADGGFVHIDMNFWDWAHDAEKSPFCQNDWRSWVGGIGEAAQRIGVTFTQAHAHVANFYRFGAESREEEMIRRSIEGAGMLGIPWIVCHPSQRPDYEEPESGAKMLRENAEYFRRHAERAAQWNVGLALENMSAARSGLTTAEQLNELISLIDMPNVGACWDTGHANLAKVDQPAAIRALRGRLHALHIADNKGESDEHVPPFFGNVDFASIVAALRETNYDGDFTFEAHNLVRKMPENCKADALRLNYRIGETLCML